MLVQLATVSPWKIAFISFTALMFRPKTQWLHPRPQMSFFLCSAPYASAENISMAKRHPKPAPLAQEDLSGKTTLTYSSTHITVVTAGEMFTWKEVILIECVPEQTAKQSFQVLMWLEAPDICRYL